MLEGVHMHFTRPISPFLYSPLKRNLVKNIPLLCTRVYISGRDLQKHVHKKETCFFSYYSLSCDPNSPCYGCWYQKVASLSWQHTETLKAPSFECSGHNGVLSGTIICLAKGFTVYHLLFSVCPVTPTLSKRHFYFPVRKIFTMLLLYLYAFNNAF